MENCCLGLLRIMSCEKSEENSRILQERGGPFFLGGSGTCVLLRICEIERMRGNNRVHGHRVVFIGYDFPFFKLPVYLEASYVFNDMCRLTF
jgi:hypothetical protein